MTLYDALQDIGKGRFVDTGCDWQMVALAKGMYTISFRYPREPLTITLTGKQGENAADMERAFYNYIDANHILYNAVTGIDYKKL